MRIAQIKSSRIMLVLGFLCPSVVFAGPIPDRFTLGRCVPADCWMFVHGASNPEREWIDKQWSEVFQALKDSGIDRDVMSLCMSFLGDAERAKAQTTIDRFSELIRGIRWADLVGREFVFAERPGRSPIGFDYILVAQGASGSGEGNASGLVAIFKEIATAVGGSVAQSRLHDVDVWEFEHEALGRIGMTVALFRTGDTIGMTTGRKTLEDIVGLLTGNSDAKSILAAPRFQEALGIVNPPEDVVSFFDIKGFFVAMGKMFDNVVQKKMAHAGGDSGDGSGTNGAPKEIAIIRKIIDQVDVFDYSVVTAATKGRREVHSHAMRIQPGKEKTPLAKAILERKPFEKFDRFIPAEATGFQLTGMIDFGLLYDAVIDFVAKEIPEGADAVAKWKGILASVGFDPKADFFDWWSGEMITVEMPPAIVTPMGGKDSVLMIRVKDHALAKTRVDTFISFVQGKLQAEGQTLMVSPAKVNAEGFQEITHPAVAMFLKPVIGVHGDWLMIGSSAASLNKCLAVESGEAPSIVQNSRFKEEGLIPKGPVRDASFKDTSRFGQELGGVVGMVGMFGGMAVAGMPEKGDEERQAKKIVQSLLSIVMKLGPVLQKIDFYSSESSMGTYDGQLTIRTESIVTYKAPKGIEAKAGTAKSKE